MTKVNPFFLHSDRFLPQSVPLFPSIGPLIFLNQFPHFPQSVPLNRPFGHVTSQKISSQSEIKDKLFVGLASTAKVA